jgi:hypothetical protein
MEIGYIGISQEATILCRQEDCSIMCAPKAENHFPAKMLKQIKYLGGKKEQKSAPRSLSTHPL